KVVNNYTAHVGWIRRQVHLTYTIATSLELSNDDQYSAMVLYLQGWSVQMRLRCDVTFNSPIHITYSPNPANQRALCINNYELVKMRLIAHVNRRWAAIGDIVIKKLLFIFM
ncbi:hypothetical protein C0J52_07870, partial [Blattella germanica]